MPKFVIKDLWKPESVLAGRVASSEKINRKGRPVPVQNDKAPFLYCHIVAIAVKLIYETGIGNDGMDGSGLVENPLNSIKPLYVAVEGFSTVSEIICINHTSQNLRYYCVITEIGKPVISR